jgi:hypothetical protein
LRPAALVILDTEGLLGVCFSGFTIIAVEWIQVKSLVHRFKEGRGLEQQWIIFVVQKSEWL